MSEINAGDAHRVPYPFYLDAFTEFDEDGAAPVSTWIPGARMEQGYDGEGDCIADGMGFMRLLVISIHKPGSYPTRVFFVRKWEDPTGYVFGKGALRVTTVGAFLRMLRGYRHEFALKTKEAA